MHPSSLRCQQSQANIPAANKRKPQPSKTLHSHKPLRGPPEPSNTILPSPRPARANLDEPVDNPPPNLGNNGANLIHSHAHPSSNSFDTNDTKAPDNHLERNGPEDALNALDAREIRPQAGERRPEARREIGARRAEGDAAQRRREVRRRHALARDNGLAEAQEAD